MRSIAALILAVGAVGAASAEVSTFYPQKETDKYWSVMGEAHDSGQATCYAFANKKDGSFVQIHRSLVDGELWILIHDTAWEMSGSDTDALRTLRWNFFGGRSQVVGGGELSFLVKDKNTIVIPQVESKPFTGAMWGASYFTIVMPGNEANLSMGFSAKGAPTLTALADCIRRNEKQFKGKAVKPDSDKVPDSVKEQI